MKKFSEVKIGDFGTDYCSLKIKILAKGIGKDPKVMQYDDSGSMRDFFDNPFDYYDYDEKDLDTLEIVAVEFIDEELLIENETVGETAVYIYADYGVTVD